MTHAQQTLAVIGAGITGLTTAYTLAHAQHTVTLYHRTPLPDTHSASYIAGGMLAPFSEIDHMPPALFQASLTSIDLWRGLIKQLHRDTGQTIPLTSAGSILLAHSQDTHMLSRFEGQLKRVNPKLWQPLNRADLLTKEPSLPHSFTQGIHLPHEAAIQPQHTINTLFQALKAHPNVTLHQTETTPKALNNQYDYIIDCRGISAKDSLPTLRGVRGEIAIVRNPDIQLTHTIRIMHPRYPLYIVPRPDNIYMIGATQIESGSKTPVSVRSAMELLSSLYSLHPSFADATIHALDSGIRPSFPNNLPQLIRNGHIIHMNGMYRHGYLMAPIMAQAVTDHINGAPIPPAFQNKSH